jgi:L-asparaginase
MKTLPKLLVIYTGGTIGMINDPKTGQLISFNFEHMYEHIPELERLQVELVTKSFKEPIDSSEMNTSLWASIAEMVKENYEAFDGFVILHGSDTMAYTASALSFMLQGLKKPVILTGSQLPIGTIRTDGKENLITAIEIAAMKDYQDEAIVQEVAVYFEYSLYRGNRCSKVSANQFEAFTSPNYLPLAVAGVDIQINTSNLFRSDLNELSVSLSMDNRIGLLKIFPGFDASVYSSLFDYSKVKGLVIETYGAGNAPSDPLFQDAIRNYMQQGGVILNITQCSSGSVQQGKYETSNFFSQIGVISGRDLTTEAALAKLMFLLGKNLGQLEVKRMLKASICGEMSV